MPRKVAANSLPVPAVRNDRRLPQTTSLQRFEQTQPDIEEMHSARQLLWMSSSSFFISSALMVDLSLEF